MRQDRQTLAVAESESNAAPKKINSRCLRVLAFTTIAFAACYAVNGVARYYRAVHQLQRSDVEAAKILSKLRKERDVPFLEERNGTSARSRPNDEETNLDEPRSCDVESKSEDFFP